MRRQALLLAAGLVWFAAGWLSLGAGAAHAATAREVRGQALDVPMARSTHPEARRALAELRRETATGQRVRLIAGLRVPFAPEGQLPPAEQVQQRADIARSQDRVQRMLIRPDARMHRFASVPYAVVEVDAAQLEALAQSSEVTSLQIDRRNRALLAQSVAQVAVPPLWPQGLRGQGTVVAVLDEGFDAQHPFLQGRVLRELCFSSARTGLPTPGGQFEYSLCPAFAEQAEGAGAASACTIQGVGWACNHGTHVAGIALGGGDPQVSFSGVAPEAGLIAVQVFNFETPDNTLTHPDAGLVAYDSNVVRGLEAVYALRAVHRIAAVNLSLGGGRYASAAACDAANLAYKAVVDNLRSAGIATVAAAGNAGYAGALASPGCVSSVISVGAVWDAAGQPNNGTSDDGQAITDTQASEIDRVVWFSNTADFLQLLAPGARITSSVLRAGGKGAYDTYAGTSMAAPHVAGCMALLKQALPGATVDQMLQSLRNTGRAVTDWRMPLTHRRIDCQAALASLRQATPVTLSVAVSGGGRVLSEPAGVACGPTGSAANGACSAAFAQGTRVGLRPLPDAGQRFVAWGGACSGSGTCTVTLDAARSVSAQFAGGAQLLSLAKSGTGRGSITATPALIDCGPLCQNAAASVAAGTTLTLRAAPDSNSRFAGWSGACSGSADCVITAQSGGSAPAVLQVGAAFAANAASLSVQRSGPGTVRSEDGAIDCSGAAADRCALQGDAGRVVSLVASTGLGSRFEGWGGACSGTGLCVVTLSAAQTVTAQFAPITHTLRVVKQGSGDGRVSAETLPLRCDTGCPLVEQALPLGTRITLRAEPAPGATFVGWELACRGAADCVVGLSEDMDVVARFDGAAARGEPETRITQLYVALFGRAPDAEGLAFWRGLLQQGQSTGELADRMLATDPSRSGYYPDSLAPREVIASVYLNVLGRSADAPGLDFWTQRLQQAGATRGTVIAQIVDVAANYRGDVPEGVQSMRYFNQRVQVAQYYAQRDGRLAGATTALDGVDGDAQRAVQARLAIDRALPVFGGFRTGDSLSYALAETIDGGAPRPFWITRYYAQYKPDGAFTTVATTLGGGERLQFELNAQLQEQYQASATRFCDNEPKRDAPGPGLQVGDRWDFAYTRTCVEQGVSTVRQHRNSGEVVARETVDTRAGRFDALRLEYTVAVSGGAAYAYRYRCWRDIALQRTVKCEYADGTSPTQGRAVYTQELVALQVAALPAAVPDAALAAVRFAGNWRLLLATSGDPAAGWCDLVVQAGGAVSGTCAVPQVDGSTRSRTVAGQVDAQGALTASTADAAPAVALSISGTLRDPLRGTGRWQEGIGSGDWLAHHP